MDELFDVFEDQPQAARVPNDAPKRVKKEKKIKSKIVSAIIATLPGDSLEDAAMTEALAIRVSMRFKPVVENSWDNVGYQFMGHIERDNTCQ